MTALSKEQDNYVRLSLLLTGTSPRAVKAIFDREFHPSCLVASLKNEYFKLKEMKDKRVISASQWNMLFPKLPDVPNSNSFDVTLMITLLRSLTTIYPPHFGYDCLPSYHEISESSDLARIKYYRNYLAHLKCNEVETGVFITAWEDISQAVFRLGGRLMKEECDDLRSKSLDQSNVQMMHEIHISHVEIENLKVDLGIVQIKIQDIKESQQNWQFQIPRNVRTQFSSETSVKVEWEPPEKTNIHLQGYKIFWKEKGTNASEHFKEVPKDENSAIVDGLMEMTNYWVWVSAVFNEEEERLHHSQQIIFRTQKGVPTRPPQKLTCIPNQNGTSIDVHWEPPPEEQTANISGYNVYIQNTSDSFEKEAACKTSVACRTILTDLIPSTKYRIWISALSINGCGPPSEPSIISTNACSTNCTGFTMFNGCNFRKARIRFKMPAALSENMAPNQGNMSSQKRELNQENQLLLNIANAMSVEPPKKCKKVKKVKEDDKEL